MLGCLLAIAVPEIGISGTSPPCHINATPPGPVQVGAAAAFDMKCTGSPTIQWSSSLASCSPLVGPSTNCAFPAAGIALVRADATYGGSLGGGGFGGSFGAFASDTYIMQVVAAPPARGPKSDEHVAFVKVATDLAQGSIPGIDGHSWIEIISLRSGHRQTWGTWGNLSPEGLYADLELSRSSAVSRSQFATQDEYDKLVSVIEKYGAKGDAAWTEIKNCTEFAKDGWKSVSGEKIDTLFNYSPPLRVPTPTSVLYWTIDANGGISNRTINECNSPYCASSCPPYAFLCHE